MNEMEWEYFGRDGIRGYTELYRAPASVPDGFEKFAFMQRLRKGGEWRDAFDDKGLKNDWASGWFDFDDNKITKEEAEALSKEWAELEQWPGRP